MVVVLSLHFSCVHEVDSNIKSMAELAMRILFCVLLAPGHGSQAAFCMATHDPAADMRITRPVKRWRDCHRTHLKLASRCFRALRALRRPKLELGHLRRQPRHECSRTVFAVCSALPVCATRTPGLHAGSVAVRARPWTA